MSKFEQSTILPDDFISFICRNYERIDDIQKKIEQFQLEDDKRKSLLKHRRYHNAFESTDSCFSDRDIAKVISARVVPKIAHLESLDRIRIGSEDLDQFIDKSFESENQVDILQKYPLVSLTINKSEKHEGVLKSLLQIHGVHVALVKRESPCSERAPNRKSNKVNYEQRHRPSLTHKKLKNKIAKSALNKKWKSSMLPTNEIFSSAHEQLTLPPLHSSVLTLLGQKSSLKVSPRNVIAQDAFINPGAAKHKKLRRHGRHRRKSESKKKIEARKTDNEDENEPEENKRNEKSHENDDEPNETQMSTMNHVAESGSHPDDNPHWDESGNQTTKNVNRLITEVRKPLYQILDEKMYTTQWNPEEISNLDQEIQGIYDDFKKYETKFKSANIGMKEDLWLALPRTWSRTSATFGIPNNPKILKMMEPTVYLKNYVKISPTRIHLYNLVFHRHRTIENPTGKHISIQAAKRGISEVLGRNFSDDELHELAFKYFGLKELSCEVDESLFRGVCAFCERVFGTHSLEDCEVCNICSHSDTKDKTRCHMKQRSHLERADFEYISTKIRNNEVQSNLSSLLKAICDKD